MPTPTDLFHWLGDTLSTPERVRIVAWVFIGLYYVVSLAFIWRARSGRAGAAKKNGLLDIVTSAFWFFFAVVLIWSLVAQATGGTLTLTRLVEFYVFFLFLFAFLYGLVEWHFPGKLKDVQPESYEAEVQYLLVSIGAQTLSGYTRAAPVHWSTESIAAVQTLLGLAFIALWVATAVG